MERALAELEAETLADQWTPGKKTFHEDVGQRHVVKRTVEYVDRADARDEEKKAKRKPDTDVGAEFVAERGASQRESKGMVEKNREAAAARRVAVSAANAKPKLTTMHDHAPAATHPTLRSLRDMAKMGVSVAVDPKYVVARIGNDKGNYLVIAQNDPSLATAAASSSSSSPVDEREDGGEPPLHLITGSDKTYGVIWQDMAQRFLGIQKGPALAKFVSEVRRKTALLATTADLLQLHDPETLQELLIMYCTLTDTGRKLLVASMTKDAHRASLLE